MGLELRKRYLFLAGILIVASVLSLFLRLDYSNASLLLKELRIPRLILGIAVGAGLSISGLILQTVLSNPLAEPYTLGIASGAALGAAIQTSLRIQSSLFGLKSGAVLGAGAVIALILRLISRGVRGQETLILFGVMVSLVASSGLAIWMALADPLGVQSVNYWLLGDLGRASLASSIALLTLVTVIAAYFFVFSKNLDAFLFGEEWVESFGVSSQGTRKIAIALVSVMVGFSVSAAGIIGFVGIVVPHLVRRWVRIQRHFHLIPFCYLGGAALLTLSDSLARVVGEPRELPVGAVTALLGAPAFIWLFMRAKQKELE
jgi:ABC-type Fe3+-siderophore transport system permease subunit